MTDKNDVVIVQLDRPRELRFGHKALKRLAAATGKGVENLGGDELDLEELEKIFFYGFEKEARQNGETLTLEMMEDILDFAPSYPYLIEKMNEAFNKSFGGFAEGNFPTPAKTPAKPTRGTGKKV